MTVVELIDTLKQIANDVYKELGSPYPESVYRNAMEVDLRLRSIRFESEKVLEVEYKKHYVGVGYLDLLVGEPNEQVIVELKAARTLAGDAERQQLRKYLTLKGVNFGLLIDFPQKSGDESSSEDGEGEQHKRTRRRKPPKPGMPVFHEINLAERKFREGNAARKNLP